MRSQLQERALSAALLTTTAILTIAPAIDGVAVARQQGIANTKATADEIRKRLGEINVESGTQCNLQMVANWNYLTDGTTEHEEELTQANILYKNYQGTVQKELKELGWDSTTGLTDADKRQLHFLQMAGPGLLGADSIERMSQLGTELESHYSTTTVPCYHDRSIPCALEPDITNAMASSDDPSELLYYWGEWRRNSANPNREKFFELVELSNDMAKANGLANNQQLWLDHYLPVSSDDRQKDVDLFVQQVENIWLEVKPLYELLFTYVRRGLYQRFPTAMRRYGKIPAHLTGNMWAQVWGNLASSHRPYPDLPDLDVTEELVKQGKKVEDLFTLADDFFSDMGGERVPADFLEKSMIVKPSDGRNVTCHASAEDFCDSKDWRIKMCTELTHEHLRTVHHEMGHIQYFMQYKDLPFIFRDGANPGFHEAIGDCIALSVATPKHLQTIGLLDKDIEVSEELMLNYLYKMALDKVAFLPYGLALDKWRWGLFTGDIPHDQANEKWWELRKEYQGIEPNRDRPDSEGFLDPLAKYHVPAQVPYIRYFVSYVIQFQFYEALCREAGQYGQPGQVLYACDFAGSKEAGTLFNNMLRKGLSEPWEVLFQEVTGSSQMSAQSLLNYFAPLKTFLEAELAKETDCLGWNDQECSARLELQNVFEAEASNLCQKANEASFDYNTDLEKPGASDLAEETAAEYSKFLRDTWQNYYSKFDSSSFKDEVLVRELKLMSQLDESALSDEDILKYNQIIAEQSGIYGKATICPFNNQQCQVDERIGLDSGIEDTLASSRTEPELRHIWREWHDTAGASIQESYKQYVELMNKAAAANQLSDGADMWLAGYEMDNFAEVASKLWTENEKLQSFYNRTHAYVRSRLLKAYPDAGFDANSPIPAHLLGNMWAQDWTNIYNDLLIPFPDAPSIDVSDELAKMDLLEMFDLANSFFVDTDLEDVSEAYGNGSMIEEPTDGRKVLCHASAWDFCDGKDFRLKMCTHKTTSDFLTIHHELGHIQYYKLYKDKSITFRQGANPGFHEAVGDVMALSVVTPTHLKTIGLLPDDFQVSKETNINFLFQQVLTKIIFLPFALSLDTWRWEVFKGLPQSEWTYRYWELKERFQGLKPPTKRNTRDSFDPGAKYHVAAGVEYIRYFVSYVIQFQFQKSLCKEIGHTGPLHECDVYKDSRAGQLFRSFLSLGKTQHWTEIMKTLGYDGMDASALLEYFQPLDEWLDEQIVTEKIQLGWVSEFSSMIEVPPEEPENPGEAAKKKQVVPIIVGVSLAVLVVAVMAAYLINKNRKKQKAKRENRDLISR